jgi:hypothetical protein
VTDTGVPLGQIGAWFNPRYDDDTRTQFVIQAEQLGYPTAWLGGGRASISDLSLVERVLDATTAITVAIEIVNMWTNDPADIAESYQRDEPRRHGVSWAVEAVPEPFCTHCVGQPARPQKTRTARPRATICSSLSRPMRSPSFERGMVVILSTITLQTSWSPLASFGSMRIRNRGASVGSVVKAQTVTESVASNRSSCTITTGRGLPTYPLPAAAVQMSPRLNRRSG